MAQTKLAPCPNCCPVDPSDEEYKTYRIEFTASEEWNDETQSWDMVWECNNCRFLTPRRINKRHKRITPSQRIALRQILRRARDIVGQGDTRLSQPVRIKFLSNGAIFFTFSMCPSRAQFGSQLYLVCNTSFCLVVGKRGGIENPNTKSKGFHNALWDCSLERYGRR